MKKKYTVSPERNTQVKDGRLGTTGHLHFPKFSSPHIFCLEEKNVDGAAGRNRPFPEEEKKWPTT